MLKKLAWFITGLMIAVTGSTLANWDPNGYSYRAGSSLFYNSLFNNGTNKIVQSSTTPVLASGFGSAASILSSNGTAIFRVNTGGAASTGIITLPAASTGWGCTAQTTSGVQPYGEDIATASGTTQVILTNYVSGVQTNWSASSVVTTMCAAY